VSLHTLTPEDRIAAQDILEEAFDSSDLEDVLAQEGLYLGYQSQFLGLSGPQRKKRLAHTVALVFGDQLLRSSPIVRKISMSRGLEEIRVFKPGTKSAVEQCKSFGLPPVFAGVQTTGKLNPLEIIEPNLGTKPLFDYQNEVLEKALSHCRKGEDCLVSLPTGGGKTRVATEMLFNLHAEKPGAASLWLAQTEELCDQAVECILEKWRSGISARPAVVFRAWGRYRQKLMKGERYDDAQFSSADLQLDRLIVATPQSAASLLAAPPEGSLGDSVKRLYVTVIDEAHRAAAPTYRKIFASCKKYATNHGVIVGLSATPIRETYASDPYRGTEQLRQLFLNLVEPVSTLGYEQSPTITLQERGILSRLEIRRTRTVRMSPAALAEYVQEHLPASDAKIPSLVFTEDVASAKIVASFLVEKGISAEAVASDTSFAERRAIIDGLRRGSIEVLCNCELLTTGFDSPNVGQIFLARSTSSPILYKQILGRGLRGPAVGGNEFCVLHLCGASFPFDDDPNTEKFAREVWGSGNRPVTA